MIFRKSMKNKFVNCCCYLCLLVIFWTVALLWGSAGWGTNTQGASCDNVISDNGEFIGNVSTAVYFQWFWDDLPCRFTDSFYWGFYLMVIPLYLLVKLWGQKLLQKQTGLAFNLSELFFGWLLYALLLANQTLTVGIKLNPEVIFNLLKGSALLLWPLFTVILLVAAARKIDELYHNVCKERLP